MQISIATYAVTHRQHPVLNEKTPGVKATA